MVNYYVYLDLEQLNRNVDQLILLWIIG